MKIHYNQNLKPFSRALRKQGTWGEVLLWKHLRARKLGYQFMRQKPVLSFIVDFYCSPLKLAVEIDGVTHDGKVETDERRQKEIESLGIKLLRFTEREVRENLDSVLREIVAHIQKLTTPVIADDDTPFVKGDRE